MAVDDHAKAGPQREGADTNAVEYEVDIGALGVGGQTGGCFAATLQKIGDTRDQGLRESRPDHFPEEALFSRAAGGDLGVSQAWAEEIPHDFVVALAVHPLLHGFAGLDTE